LIEGFVSGSSFSDGRSNGCVRSMKKIDLNCDLGEGAPDDAAVMPFITSANVACGVHAGNPTIMRQTLEAAAEAGVAVGAHPGFADRESFGRRPVELPAEQVHDLVLYQIGALMLFARQAGLRLQHVKPHGALYHVAAERPEIADAVARATRATREDLLLVGPPDSALSAAAAACQLRFAVEIFADRQYAASGRLVPRGQPGAVLDLDDAAVAARAVAMVREGVVPTVAGTTLPQIGHTVCLHGDHPGAASRALAIRSALESAGITVAPLGGWL
jgi:5-oxoprolinase (ATP-hydrolysing) subunit A